MKTRLKKISRQAGAILAVGLIYAVICLKLGRAIFFCPFYQLTGLQCPGCGVSRMCLHLINLEFAQAFAQNQALFVLLPVLLVLWLSWAVRYVRTGTSMLRLWQRLLLWLSIGVMVVFGILRNIPGFF